MEPTTTPASFRLVICNAPPDRALELARAVVSGRLAACVNVLPGVQSVYEWQGRLECETESTLLIKTTAERVPALTARLRELHPYEVPEVIALPLADGEGYAPYLQWVAAQVAPR